MRLLWLGGALLSLAFWVALGVDRRRAWPSALRLSPDAPPPEPLPSVTVVIPARNEAAILPTTLPTVLDQAWDAVEVIVVDDQSSDGTAEAAARAAAHRPAHVVRIGERRAGWTGKLAALERGFSEAVARRPEVEWLLFTDADIAHHERSLAALLAKAAAGPFDLVSVMARLNARSLWERLLVPPFVYFFHLLYPFPAVADPSSRVAAAAGGCVLIRRRALLAAGGLEAIRDAVIDDVALGRAVKRSGGRVWLGLDPGIVSLRPYRGLDELWRMVARSAFVQLDFRWSLVLLVLIGLLLVVVSPPVHVAAGLAALLAGGDRLLAAAVLGVGAVAWGLEARALVPAVRHHRVPERWALTLPLAGLLYGAMTLTSALEHWRGRGASWKGRTYRAGPRGARSEQRDPNLR